MLTCLILQVKDRQRTILQRSQQRDEKLLDRYDDDDDDDTDDDVDIDTDAEKARGF